MRNYAQTNGLWPAAILHVSHNLFVQLIFAGMTVPTSLTLYFSGEFGMLVPLTAALVVWLVLRHWSGVVAQGALESARPLT